MAVDDRRLFELLPHAPLDHDNAEHYRGLLDERLLLNRCRGCGYWHHPPLPRCPACRGVALEATEVAGTGTVFLATVMHQGPPAEGVDYAAAPHPVVTVELDEQPGLRFTAAYAAGPNDHPAIGERVRLVWGRRHGLPLATFAPVPHEGRG